MPKYSGPSASTRKGTSMLRTETPLAVTSTYEGDKGFLRDEKSELFTLAVTFMGEQESTFYETGNSRQERFTALIHSITASDPEWMRSFVPFLRNTAQMRTASIVAVAEYIKAGGPNGASLVDATLARADEPSEILGYWLAKYGRSLPQPLKRGIARASSRLFTEYAAMKYDGNSRGVRLGDVIELTHPKPSADWQSALFKYLLDRRHHPTAIRADFGSLPKVSAWIELQAVPEVDRRAYLRSRGPEAMAEAGMTWERLSGWLVDGMDAEAWESVIPSMGYMALLRNLRNFDQAGISQSSRDYVISVLSNPEAVARSRQFPYRFISALKEVGTFGWHSALESALDLSIQNIPKLKGRSLVLVDVSGSMDVPISNNSKLCRWEAGALFGIAQYLRAQDGDIVAFGTDSLKVDIVPGSSTLSGIDQFVRSVKMRHPGHGTDMWRAVAKHFNGHDRVFIFTDLQSFGSYHRPVVESSLSETPIYSFNLAGYKAANMAFGGIDGKPHYELVGLNDVTFRQIPLLESGRNARWPWEA